MIAEKAADMIREKDTVQAIKEYFRHLYEIKHKKVIDEEEVQHVTPEEAQTDNKKPWRVTIILCQIQFNNCNRCENILPACQLCRVKGRTSMSAQKLKKYVMSNPRSD